VIIPHMRTCHAFFPAAALLAIPGPARAQAVAVLASQQFDVDGMHSTVGFTARILRFAKVRGRFRQYDVALTYDSAHLERSSVTAIIVAKSIDTDMDFRDKHLRSPDFFATDSFPTIEFQSDRVMQRPGGVLVSGPLTMRGITRRINFVANVVPLPRVGPAGDVSLALEADLRLNRMDFGIAGTNAFNPDFDPATNLVGDSVDINLELLMTRQGYLNRPISDLARTLGGGSPPGVVDTIARTLTAHGAPAAADLYRTLRAAAPLAFNFGVGQLDVLGHVLEARGRLTDALTIFNLNAEVYPSSDVALESLAEAEALSGNAAQALATYRRAAAVEPNSATAKEMIRRLSVGVR
jgi:polyisoprenoid-binding protein YceI